MSCMLNKRNLMGIALGLFLVVASPVAAAGSSHPTNVTIPDWLTRIQYPGTSSEPTVYVNGPIAIPAWLARIQYPGTSSQPMVVLEAPARREGRTQPVRMDRLPSPRGSPVSSTPARVRSRPSWSAYLAAPLAKARSTGLLQPLAAALSPGLPYSAQGQS